MKTQPICKKNRHRLSMLVASVLLTMCASCTSPDSVFEINRLAVTDQGFATFRRQVIKSHNREHAPLVRTGPDAIAVVDFSIKDQKRGNSSGHIVVFPNSEAQFGSLIGWVNTVYINVRGAFTGRKRWGSFATGAEFFTQGDRTGNFSVTVLEGQVEIEERNTAAKRTVSSETAQVVQHGTVRGGRKPEVDDLSLSEHHRLIGEITRLEERLALATHGDRKGQEFARSWQGRLRTIRAELEASERTRLAGGSRYQGSSRR